jgi:hypothetical protein
MDDESKKMADEEWRTNSAHLNCEGQLRELLEFIEDGGRSALKFEKLNADDRKTIEIGCYELLWAVLGHAWALGAKADVPESSRRFWQTENAKGERPKTTIIRQAILERLESNSNARANEIHNELIESPPAGLSTEDIKDINQSTFDSIVSRARRSLRKTQG